MRKNIVRLFRWLARRFEKKNPMNVMQSGKELISPIVQLKVELLPLVLVEENPAEETKNLEIVEKKRSRRKKSAEITEFNPRDLMEVMEVPFLSLSKNRKKPISYQSKDGKIKVKITCNTDHYLASIYDWDIILFSASKIQEIINHGADIPPRTIIIPRHELLKAIHKLNVKKQKEDLESSLNRLSSTLIDTTIRNEDYRYRGGFSFIDSWGYTERKDVKEFRITLSQWLYDGICKRGSLLKVSQGYFDITSGLKKFLYRTARKHLGNNDFWEFTIERLYEKSASEQEFKKFKYDLKNAVLDNDIPEYFIEWMEEENKTLVRFTNKRKELTKMLTK